MVLGVDPSLTHTALVLGTTSLSAEPLGETTSYQVKLDAKRFEHTVARLAAIHAHLESILEAIEEDHGGPGVLVLEGYGFAAAHSRPHSLGEWGGVLRLTAYRRGWTLVIAPPTTLKKFVTGKGVAEKDKMMMEVLDRWKYKASDNNNADAYALMRLGLVFRRRVLGQSVLQKDADTLKAVEVCLPAA